MLTIKAFYSLHNSIKHMTQVHQLTYGPFAENTYLISDDEGNAIVLDPGMYDAAENVRFFEYINTKQLKPKQLLLTHAHLDHVFGVNWINSQYDLKPTVHAADKIIYDNAALVARQYGLQMKPLVAPNIGLEHNSTFTFGNSIFKVILAPGHSPGSVCFYNKEEEYVIAGDVLFQGSIGRTDLPGGNHDLLLRSIATQLLSLPDAVTVYSGHGPITTIGQERIANPFLQDL
jgi:hydroxyacylglutathione hydrolase